MKPQLQRLPRVIVATALLLAVTGSHRAVGSDAEHGRSTPSRAVQGTHECNGFYPEISRHRNERGDVWVRYDVRANGSITNVTLVKSSGYDLLDRAALLCVSQRWRNTPAMKDGVPIASPNHEAIVRYTLHDVDYWWQNIAGYREEVSYLIVFFLGLEFGLWLVTVGAWRRARRAARAAAKAQVKSRRKVPIGTLRPWRR